MTSTPEKRAVNVVGIIALIVAIIGLPIFLAEPFTIRSSLGLLAGLLLGIVGIIHGRKSNRGVGLSIAAVIIGGAPLAIAVLLFATGLIRSVS
jgi:hypothetical protein